MTIEESVRLQERISNKLSPLAMGMVNSIPDVTNLFLDQYNSIIQSLNSAMITPTYLSTIANTMSYVQQKFVSMYSGIDYQGICAAISCFERIQENLVNNLDIFDTTSYQPIQDSLENTLTYVEPYLPPEKKEECESVILPKLSKESKAKLTLGDAVAILSLLVSIFFGIITSLPNGQTERLIAQNETILTQQDEIIQLEKEDEELLNALNSLTDSINLLSEEVEALREESESPENISDGQNLLDVEDSQDEHSNTED